MNVAIITGRLTRDPERRDTKTGNDMVRFTVAVDRSARKDGTKETDFISCVAFGKTAEFIERWFVKGKPISLRGRIRTTSWTDKDGNKRSGMDVVAESAEFVLTDTTERKEAGPAVNPFAGPDTTDYDNLFF